MLDSGILVHIYSLSPTHRFFFSSKGLLVHVFHSNLSSYSNNLSENGFLFQDRVMGMDVNVSGGLLSSSSPFTYGVSTELFINWISLLEVKNIR
jgi:hypothetical protein